MSRPWRLRLLLYAAGAALAAPVAIFAPSGRAIGVLALVVGGALTSLKPGADDPRSARIVAAAAYDLAVAMALAALGLQYAAVLVTVMVITALALLRPTWSRWVAPAAGAVGAAVALLSIQVGGMQPPIRGAALGPAFALFAPMAAGAAISAGLSLLISAAGLRLHALAAAQEQLRASLDLATRATVVADDGRIVYANPAAIVLTGRSLVDDSLVDVLGVSDLPDAGRLQATLASAGLATSWVELECQPIAFDGRHLTQVTMTELQEAGRTHASAAPAGRRLDLLFDRIPVALYRSTPDGDVTAANRALAEMLGLSDPTELIGAVEKARDHYRDTSRREAWLRQFEDSDVVMDFEMQLMRADGSEIVVTDSARAVRDHDGRILFFEGVLIDVTAQRESERARQRNSEILDETSDLVWLTDEEDRVTRVNAAMRRFLAVGEGEVIGSHIGAFMVDDGDACQLTEWRHTPDSDRIWRGEVTLRAPDGREVLTSAVGQRHRRFVSLVARDITAERRTADELERLVRAKDEFIASVSHELRTPLTAVVGLASELANYFDELTEDTKRDFIATVSDQAAEVAAIVEDLLVAARADTDSITLMHDTVDVRAAVDGVLGALAEAKRGMFDVTGSGTACGDAQRIRQIVRNLVTNAIRYGELPASVTIGVDGDDIVVAVADKGPGIEPTMIERVFQPYERAHAAVTQPNSVGLGLSVSRWLAEKMGGSLMYENDGMSTFFLRLPATRCT